MNPLETSKSYLSKPVQGETTQSEKISLIEKMLPVEVFFKILSELNESSFESAVRVNSFWKTASMNVVQRREFSDIKNFAKLLGEHLNEHLYNSQREKLFDIDKGRMILNAVNLKQIKVSKYDLKEEMINILKEIKSNDLKYLQQLHINSPEFLRDIFLLAKIYRKVDKAKATPPGQAKDKRRSLRLKTTAESLIRLGRLEKALEAATAIPSTGFTYNRVYSYYLLEDISNAFLQQGNLEKSLTTAMLYQNREELRLFIAKNWIEEGYLDKALESTDLNKMPGMAAMLPDMHLKSLFLEAVSRKWVEKGNLDKALDIAVMISDKAIQSLTLEAISRNWLEEKNNVSRALEVAAMIPNETIKSSLIKKIS